MTYTDTTTHAVENISYRSEFSLQPSGDFQNPDWTNYIRGAITHWIGTGLDGFVFDWPEGYLDCDGTCVKTQLVNLVHATPNVAAFGEGPYDNRSADTYGFDASQTGPASGGTDWATTQAWTAAVNTRNTAGIEGSDSFLDRDRHASLGGLDYETLNPGVLNNDRPRICWRLRRSSARGTS